MTKNINNMECVISVKDWDMVCRAACATAYRKVKSIKFDELKSAALEGMINARTTYKEGHGTKFTTYAYLCMESKMRNKIDKNMRRERLMREDENVELERLDHLYVEIPNQGLVDGVKALIRKATKNNERNTRIVELALGVDTASVPLKDLAEDFGLSYECVRRIYANAMTTMRADKKAEDYLYSFVG